ncbi:hypothetical protein CDAR_168321 [Caerostris darwini]|uniref:Uncharacterized protein n=1 Tax=Caerostris darwini TaxID=1538125 RepID=A0AAV4T4C0_9ARAC|nr:hypothetical protein CDAR_168321 [Caerostris darwini]
MKFRLDSWKWAWGDRQPELTHNTPMFFPLPSEAAPVARGGYPAKHTAAVSLRAESEGRRDVGRRQRQLGRLRGRSYDLLAAGARDWLPRKATLLPPCPLRKGGGH